MAVAPLARMLDADEDGPAVAAEGKPVISHSFGPTRKRLISPVAGSPISIWLLPMPAKSPAFE